MEFCMTRIFYRIKKTTTTELIYLVLSQHLLDVRWMLFRKQ